MFAVVNSASAEPRTCVITTSLSHTDSDFASRNFAGRNVKLDLADVGKSSMCELHVSHTLTSHAQESQGAIMWRYYRKKAHRLLRKLVSLS
jgi:hypothetical protein